MSTTGEYRYRLTMAYEGTRYNGWQGQGNTDNTIQAKLEAALSRLTGENVSVQASGRTDAGVHAAGQVVSFSLSRAVDCPGLMAELNRYLPQDMGVLDLAPAAPRFHARLSATGKTYVYRIWNSPLPDVFGRRTRLSVAQPLDIAAMEEAAALLTGRHDFRSFCGLTRYKKSTVRTLYAVSIRRQGDEIDLRFTGDGFLNRMVRILSGTLLEVGLGLRESGSVTGILEARDRRAAAGALSPHALTLEAVYYDEIPSP